MWQFLSQFLNLPRHLNSCNLSHFFRDADTAILIKFAFWRVPGRGQNRGKMVQNAVFLGKSHDYTYIRTYIYIYMHAGELFSVPLLGLWRGIFCTTSKGQKLYHILGAHFRTTRIRFLEIFVKIWFQFVVFGFPFFSQLGIFLGFFLTSTKPLF